MTPDNPAVTPAERLREIVADARGNALERTEHFLRYLDPALMDKPYPLGRPVTYRQMLDEDRADRAAWQAASDLLERLLELDRQQQDPGPAGGPFR